MRFEPAIDPPQDPCPEARWCLFHGDRLLAAIREGAAAIPLLRSPGAIGLHPVRSQFLGRMDSVPCFSGALETPDEPDGMAFRSLRSLLGELSDDDFALAGRAFQVMDWDRTSRFCGRCGRPTEPVPGERARACAACGTHIFPRITPAVIVAVVRDGKLLLARSTRFPKAFQSVLAGFVEPGETLEECVRREVREEVGIEVANLRYFGSQPWPFPNSLMVGFTAEHAGGELVLEEKEIASADWYSPGEVRGLDLPRPQSISRRLIDWFLSGGADSGATGRDRG
jgi:NAD+ diphosphatase